MAYVRRLISGVFLCLISYYTTHWLVDFLVSHYIVENWQLPLYPLPGIIVIGALIICYLTKLNLMRSLAISTVSYLAMTLVVSFCILMFTENGFCIFFFIVFSYFMIVLSWRRTRSRLLMLLVLIIHGVLYLAIIAGMLSPFLSPILFPLPKNKPDSPDENLLNCISPSSKCCIDNLKSSRPSL